MTLNQLKELLKEASLEYIRHGKNQTEVEYYARRVVEWQPDATDEFWENCALVSEITENN